MRMLPKSHYTHTLNSNLWRGVEFLKASIFCSINLSNIIEDKSTNHSLMFQLKWKKWQKFCHEETLWEKNKKIWFSQFLLAMQQKPVTKINMRFQLGKAQLEFMEKLLYLYLISNMVFCFVITSFFSVSFFSEKPCCLLPTYRKCYVPLGYNIKHPDTDLFQFPWWCFRMKWVYWVSSKLQ